MDEFEDDEEIVDTAAAKKSSKLTAELELLSSASGQVSTPFTKLSLLFPSLSLCRI
jgi:hypothetical protein